MRIKQSELLLRVKRIITSLEDIKNDKKSSRELVKFFCEKCGKPYVSNIHIINNNMNLYCKTCKEKQTKLERYGDPNYNNNTKRKETFQEKYGCDNVLQNKSMVDKISKTNLEKYGSKWIVQSKHFEKKSKETCLKKYGVEYSFQSENNISKSLKTRYERYKDISFNRKYFYNNEWFDSSWELAYYIWLTDVNADFIFHPEPFKEKYLGEDNKYHIYYPDFLVDGKYQEIKGNQFFNEKDEPFDLYTKNFWWNKYSFMLKHNVEIIRFSDIKLILKYISNKYGNNYLNQFKIKLKCSTTIPEGSTPK
jgi:hypothetical protein